MRIINGRSIISMRSIIYMIVVDPSRRRSAHRWSFFSLRISIVCVIFVISIFLKSWLPIELRLWSGTSLLAAQIRVLVHIVNLTPLTFFNMALLETASYRAANWSCLRSFFLLSGANVITLAVPLWSMLVLRIYTALLVNVTRLHISTILAAVTGSVVTLSVTIAGWNSTALWLS